MSKKNIFSDPFVDTSTHWDQRTCKSAVIPYWWTTARTPPWPFLPSPWDPRPRNATTVGVESTITGAEASRLRAVLENCYLLHPSCASLSMRRWYCPRWIAIPFVGTCIRCTGREFPQRDKHWYLQKSPRRGNGVVCTSILVDGWLRLVRLGQQYITAWAPLLLCLLASTSIVVSNVDGLNTENPVLISTNTVRLG